MESEKITYILFLCIVAANSRKYDNYSLFMGIPNTKEELEFYKILTVKYNVLYWKKPGLLYSSVEFSIGPSELETFLLDVHRNKISLNVVTKDLRRKYEFFNSICMSESLRLRENDGFKCLVVNLGGGPARLTGPAIITLKTFTNWLEDLQISNPDVISVAKIGSTIEQRPILAVRVKFQSIKPRPKVIIEGGIHAREWISPAFVTYMINVVVNAPSSQNKMLQDMALAYEWIFVPVLNPDGYEYTYTKDRLWAKNCRDTQGVDLNTNFDAVFGTVGVNHQKFRDSYCGEFQFSEQESRAMRDLIMANRQDLQYYIAFHSFGQNFIIPYEFSDKYMDNYKELKELGGKVVEQIKRRFETEYLVGTMHDLKGYTISGTSTSWVKETIKIPYVATFELRDSGMNGFALPAQEIMPTCLETMDGVCAFLGYSGCILGPSDNPETETSTEKATTVDIKILPLSKGHCVLPIMFLILMCFWLSL